MMRSLLLGAVALSLSGCVAVPAAALLIINAAATTATVAEAACRSGEVLTDSRPDLLDGHPVLQAAQRACEALAP